MRRTFERMRRFCRNQYATGFAVAVLVLGVAAAFAVYSLSKGLVDHEASLRFDNDSRSVEQQIATRVRLYSDVLVTMRALFAEDSAVERDEFREFVKGLDLPNRYPGFQALSYGAYVRNADLPAFVAKQNRDPMLRAAGVRFVIRPPGPRPDYNVVTYVEPLQENLVSLGIDMSADLQRRHALEVSGASGQAISSGRTLFANRGAQYVGIAMRLPVYRHGMPTGTTEERQRAYVGSVGAGIRIKDMMSGLLGAETLRVIKFRIYDAGNMRTPAISPSPSTLLFDSIEGPPIAGSTAAKTSGSAVVNAADDIQRHASVKPLQRVATQLFAGRRWTIVFTAYPDDLVGSQGYLPDVALGTGLIISALLSGLTYALSSSRARAVKLADAITFDLRSSEMARAEAQRIAHLGDWRADLNANTTHLSGEMARLIGWRRSVSPSVKVLVHTIDAADRHMLIEHVKHTLETHEPFELECRYRSRRGRRGWMRVVGQAQGATGSRVLRGTALEITKQKSVERVRELEHAFTLQLATAANEFDIFQQLVGSLTRGMDWDAGAFWPTQEGLKQLLCAAYCAHAVDLEPWLLSRVRGMSKQEDLSPEPTWRVGRHVAGLSTARWLAEAHIVTTFSFPLRIGSVVLGTAEFYSRERRHLEQHALAMARSITSQMSHFLQRRQAEDNLHFLATHDALTGLPNRLMFKEHLESSLVRADEDGTALNVLFIDLDRFKDINDSMGHNTGDQLLRAVAERLSDEVKDADMIARLGGDEFIVLVKQRNERGINVLHTIDAIQGALAQPFVVNGMQMQVSASIGVSSFPGDGEDAQTLLKHADIAMYGAKQRGKNTYQMYLRQMSMSLQRRVEMEAQLRHAIENREFTLFYQPRIELSTNHCTGVEALIRWNNPQLGLVMPSDFIPLAEETGAIVPIGEWVLREACRQAAEWRANGLSIHVAVNLSARQFADPHLHESIIEALEDARLPGELLELELTESMVMRHPEQAARWLTSVKKTGVRLSIDDFGTGYSSLAYLNRFPIDLVKIDRSFIRNVPDSHSDTQITSAVIALGHSLGLTVIAEGAETQAQIDFLRREGCDEVQGYFFSRPIPADDVWGFLGRPLQTGTGSAPMPTTKSVRGTGSDRSYHS
ncbi:bifunctional diguanylate cyclase/phosphodiesterase [Trinickia fusca]|nr:EAL domain-containing protein [Trinickia fusca]